MNREYHKWWSPRLGRDMELLVFGHAGLPVMVFPTSGGKYYEFEDRGMIGALAGKIDAGELQVYCVDAVDSESWYNKQVSPRWRIARHVQYDEYLIHEWCRWCGRRTATATWCRSAAVLADFTRSTWRSSIPTCLPDFFR